MHVANCTPKVFVVAGSSLCLAFLDRFVPGDTSASIDPSLGVSCWVGSGLCTRRDHGRTVVRRMAQHDGSLMQAEGREDLAMMMMMMSQLAARPNTIRSDSSATHPTYVRRELLVPRRQCPTRPPPEV